MLDSAVHATEPAFLAAAVGLLLALLPAVAPDVRGRPRVGAMLRWLIGSRRRR